MKIRIDKSGWLEIERAGKMKPQYCPEDNEPDDTASHCGDWCPRFSEPEDEKEPMYGGIHTSGGGHGETKWIKLKLCLREWRCKPEDFEDER